MNHFEAFKDSLKVQSLDKEWPCHQTDSFKMATDLVLCTLLMINDDNGCFSILILFGAK